ncbi:M14 family metallocarboxypeptidase [Verrucomicrobiaceae bacterium 227]
MDWREFCRQWQSEADASGFATEVLIEVDGFPVLASSKGGSGLPCIYLSSGIHGDEPAGPWALLGLLRDGFFDDRYRWLICPALNPVGLDHGTRENGEGIDLNRDYCQCQGSEVCAHIDWLKQQDVPRLFLSLHEDWESSGFYFYEINLGVGGPRNEEILRAASSTFPVEPELVIDDHEVTGPGWIFHSEHPDLPEGWPEAIYLAKMGCPLSLTFETPSSGLFESRVACHQAVVKESILHLHRSV